jgi:hypothetical protein
VAGLSRSASARLSFTRLVPLGCRSIDVGAPASFLNSGLCSLFPPSIAPRWSLSLDNCVKGSDADRFLSGQVPIDSAALVEILYRPATPAATTLHYHTTSTIGRPRSFIVEDNTIATTPSPRSFTTAEAFNRYFRSLLWWSPLPRTFIHHPPHPSFTRDHPRTHDRSTQHYQPSSNCPRDAYCRRGCLDKADYAQHVRRDRRPWVRHTGNSTNHMDTVVLFIAEHRIWRCL